MSDAELFQREMKILMDRAGWSFDEANAYLNQVLGNALSKAEAQQQEDRRANRVRLHPIA